MKMQTEAQVNRNRARLVNQLSKCFVDAFPGLKNDPRFKPIKLKGGNR